MGRRVRLRGMARVVVDVMPKPEILDPQGKAVTGRWPGWALPASPYARASGSSSTWKASSPRIGWPRCARRRRHCWPTQ